MNDFTKEELEDLYSCCGSSLHDDHPLEFWKEKLQKKIKAMIDSYCEHEFYMNGCGDNVFAQCHKCGEIGKLVR